MAVWSPTSLKKPISAAYASLYFVQNPSSKSACQSQGPHGCAGTNRRGHTGYIPVRKQARGGVQEPIAGATRGICRCACERGGSGTNRGGHTGYIPARWTPPHRQPRRCAGGWRAAALCPGKDQTAAS
eukprot:1185433-Prorocentrum_minimum.AAC.2